ncbi:DUF4340 domain-containing protein [Rhodopila globiformis]|uniref:DUF4340 domain-containing protein n=1 Tax=Rhodopila globiformis TaxID=1071 RepID=A0A2S6N7C6_RHOGL|nr:DUF4340 domain-containing protein [Rhodopila globiformis]PPQ30511.1 hypothetical protein CCS01_19120 [Rhodopila globiformis]
MRGRTAAALVAVAVVVVAGGWYFGTATTPPEQTQVASGSLMFPGLAGKLDKATKLEIVHQGKQTVIEKRPDGAWGIASLHDYPVQPGKLRGVLIGLTELRLVEPRTSDPSEYSRLAVDDPNGAKSEADLVRVVDASGKPLAALIVGHRRVRGQPGMADEVYVRRPGQAQSWLAEGSVRADPDAMQWIDRDVMDIKEDRIASVVVGDKTLVFGRVDGKFTLTEPADHPKLEEYKVDNVGRALEMLSMQAVKPDAEVTGQPAGHSVFTTKDGLVVAVNLLHADKDVWARFAVSGPEKVKAEVHRLAGKLNGWTYEIGSWKEQSLVPTMADLKAPEPPAPQASRPAAPAPVPPPGVALPAPAAGATAAPETGKAASGSEAGKGASSPVDAGKAASPADAGKAAAAAPGAGGQEAAPAEANKAAAASGSGKGASSPADAGKAASPADAGKAAAAPGAGGQEAAPAEANKAAAASGSGKKAADPADSGQAAAPATGTEKHDAPAPAQK